MSWFSFVFGGGHGSRSFRLRGTGVEADPVILEGAGTVAHPADAEVATAAAAALAAHRLTAAAATREYNQAGVRVSVTDTGTAANALPTLGASREVRLMASVRCFVRFGVPQAAPNAALLDTAATVGGTSFPLAPDSPEVVRVPAGATHFAVIRDGTTNGNVTLHAVA